MARARVLCPTTKTTELIEFVDTPLGPLIHRCSRFQPATAIACGRGCTGCDPAGEAKGKAEFETDDSAEDTDVEAFPQAPSGVERLG